MNAEVKERWVEALRSGRYQQGKEYLRRESDYCCLGVLCDLVAPDQWELALARDHFRHSGCGTMLPTSIRQTLGISYEDTGFLAGMNDVGDSFAEIAAWIEVNL